MLLSQLVNLIMQQTPGRLVSNRGSFTDGTTVEATDPAMLVTPGAGSQQTGAIEEATLGESSKKCRMQVSASVLRLIGSSTVLPHSSKLTPRQPGPSLEVCSCRLCSIVKAVPSCS